MGRLSGPKNKVILQLLKEAAPEVARVVPSVRFQVVGGPLGEEHRRCEAQFPFVRFEGHQGELAPFYANATLVVGAGRVALEAMALGKPVVAVGEKMYLGPLNPSNLDRAKETNFGDCFETEVFDWDRVAQDLVSLLQDPALREEVSKTGYQLVRSEYDMKTLSQRMESLYRRVLLEDNLSYRHEVPVLMYHRVVDRPPTDSKFNLYVTQAGLERQLLSLKRRGFEAVTFHDLSSRKLPRKPVFLTFDDGYEDHHRYLFPLLRKHGMKAVVYILGDRSHTFNFWDTPKGEPEVPLLSPGQIREMAESGLVEFGAHSLNHARLTELNAQGKELEIAGSKKALEDFLGQPVVSFAYPYGSLDEESKKIVARAGYTFGVAVGSGPTRFGKDLMEIRRINMFPHTSILEFLRKTSGYYLRYRRLLGRP